MKVTSTVRTKDSNLDSIVMRKLEDKVTLLSLFFWPLLVDVWMNHSGDEAKIQE